MAISDKAAYIRGLMEGMNLDTTTNEGKLLGEITALLSEMAAEVDDLNDRYDELSEYVDSIDEDLSAIEEIFDGDEEDDCCDCDDDCCDCDDDCCDCDCCCGDEDEEEEEEEMDPDNIFVECVCPECRASFYARESQIGQGNRHICPHCKKPVEAVPEYEAELPVAELADDEQD